MEEDEQTAIWFVRPLPYCPLHNINQKAIWNVLLVKAIHSEGMGQLVWQILCIFLRSAKGC